MNWHYVPPLGIGLVAFGLGYVSHGAEKDAVAMPCFEKSYQELAILELLKIEGDTLQLNISGPVRLVWNDDFLEGDGRHAIFLGQLPSDRDQSFRDFAYVGNAGTFKFYPSNTYAARGTDPGKRRFFATKEAALEAGFVPSKLVK